MHALKSHRQRRLHRAATFMSEDHEQLCLEVYACVLEASPDVRGGDVAGDANDEEVTKLCIKNQFRRDPRVAATKNGRKWTLALDEISESLPRSHLERSAHSKESASPSIKRARASSAPTSQSS